MTDSYNDERAPPKDHEPKQPSKLAGYFLATRNKRDRKKINLNRASIEVLLVDYGRGWQMCKGTKPAFKT